MLGGKRIKIIKQAERSDSQPVEPDNESTRTRRARERIKRDAVSVVTEWVSELRRRKSEESANGFDNLFRKAA